MGVGEVNRLWRAPRSSRRPSAASARPAKEKTELQTDSQIIVNPTQLAALENGCGLVRWETAVIVEHSGPDALDLLHRLTTNELLSVAVGQARRTVLTTDRGRVVDVFLVAHVSENRLLLVSDSGNSERAISAIDYYTIIEDAELTDLSRSHTRISLIGPMAAEISNSILGLDVERGHVGVAEYAGAPVAVISDTSRGVEWIDIVLDSDTENSEHALEASLESAGAVAVDPHNFDLYRISHGIPGPDREYGDHTNPIESGLLDLIDFEKGCYVGQEVVARLDAYDKVKRNLKVLESEEPLDGAMPVQLLASGKPAGIITSVSPLKTANGAYLGLGLVRKAFLAPGTTLEAEAGPNSNRITVRVR